MIVSFGVQASLYRSSAGNSSEGATAAINGRPESEDISDQTRPYTTLSHQNENGHTTQNQTEVQGKQTPRVDPER